MDMHEFDRQSERVTGLLADLFEIGAVYRRNNELVFSLNYRYSRKKSEKHLRDRLKMAGYRFELLPQDDILVLQIDPKPRLHIPPLNIVLFLVTLVSVYVVPVFLRDLSAAFMELGALIDAGRMEFQGEVWMTLKAAAAAWPMTLEHLAHGEGLEFTLAMVSILFVHEMGHFIAGRRRNIITSWPYFIPAPNIIGTFGAIIKMKSPFFNRRDLIEVGSAGPIAGWIVALGWLLYGLSQSSCLPPAAFTVRDLSFSLEGESILMRLGTLALIGPAPDGYFYKLTEAAFAGWVGLLVTAINLLPIGQLDGGHIVYGLTRRSQHVMGIVAMAGLIVLGFQSSIWWFFAAFGLIFGMKHPPTLDDSLAPSRTSRIMGIVAVVILILSFTPVPFR